MRGQVAGALGPAAVAGGISEALLCTAGGLIVAALSTVEFNYFTTRVNSFVLRVQAAGTALVERILDAQANDTLPKSQPVVATAPRPRIATAEAAIHPA